MSEPTHHPTSIRVAGVPEHFNFPWHVGIESGEFSALGLEVDFTTCPGGTGEMMQAVANRKVDVAVVLTEGCIQSICNGSPARIIKTYVQSPLIWGIHTAASSPIEHIDQIRNRRYAISRYGSGSHLMAIVDAAERGWETGLDFEVVKNLQGAREALAGGAADVFFWERYTTSPFVENGEFKRLADRLTPWPAFVVCVNQESLAEKSAAISDLLNHVNAICDRLTEDSKTTQRRIADRYQINPEKVHQWWATTQWNTDWEVQRSSLTNAIDYLRKLNLIDVDPAITSNKIFDDVCAIQFRNS